MEFNLHPYQKEAIAQVETCSEDVCVTLPTGTGKSVTAIALIDRLVATGARILVCVPYTPLVSQFRDEILQFFPHLAPSVGIYAAEFGAAARKVKRAKIVIAMLQTIEARCITSVSDDGERQTIHTVNGIPGSDFTHIILDEAHLSAFRVGYSALRMLYPKARFIYLTATPYRDDGGQLPPSTRFIQTITVADAIREDYLADYEIYPMLPQGIPTGVDAEKYSPSMSSIITQEMLLAAYQQNSADRRSLFIFPDKDALNYYLTAFADAGLSPMVVIDSTKMKERDKIFSRFKAEANAIIFSVNVLCAGCNLPSAEDLYLLRTPGLSMLTQIGGRVLRRWGDKVARIYDCFNAFLNHPSPKRLPPWTDLISRNGQGKRCKDCGRINPSDSEWCLDCGQRIKKNIGDGKLEQLAQAIDMGVGLLAEQVVGTATTQMRNFGAPLIECVPSQSSPEVAFAFFKQRCFLRKENPRKVFVLMRQAGFTYSQIQQGARDSRGAIFKDATVGTLWLYSKYLLDFVDGKQLVEILEQEFPTKEVVAWRKLRPM